MGVKQMGVTAGGMVAAAILPASIVRHGWSPTLIATAAVVMVLGIAGAFAYRSVTGGSRPHHRPTADRPEGVTRRLLSLGAVVGMLVAAQHAVATYLTLFVVDERGASVAAAAAATHPATQSGTVARLGWGYVSDRLPGGRLPTIALVGTTSVVGLVGLAVVGDSLPWPALLVLVALLGVSTHGGNAVYQTAFAEEDEARAGRASGIGMTLGFAGAIVMPPAFGAAVDAIGSYTVPSWWSRRSAPDRRRAPPLPAVTSVRLGEPHIVCNLGQEDALAEVPSQVSRPAYSIPALVAVGGTGLFSDCSGSAGGRGGVRARV
jgi:nitrate/nitrite transporter NarK